MLKFLMRRKPVPELGPMWTDRAAPSSMRSLGISPLSLTMIAVPSVILLFFIGMLLALTPVGVVVLFAFMLTLFGLVKLVAKLAPGAPWWIKGVFLVVSAQMVLNAGFGSIFIGPSSAPLPLSELVLAFALLASFLHVLIYKENIRLPWGIWVLLIWMIFNLSIHMPRDFETFGMAAARDGIRLVEFLYIIPAYVSVSLALSGGDPGKKWLKSLLYGTAIAIGVYGLCCPFQSFILAHSPGFPSLQKWVPVFGNFQTWPMAGLMGIFGALLWRWAFPGKLRLWQWFTLGMIIVSGFVAFIVMQSRAGYVFMVGCMGVLFVIGGQGKQVKFLVSMGVLGAAVLFIIEVSGVQFQGRVGKLSLSGVADHVMTLTGQSTNSEFHGAAGGISQRTAWRNYSLGLWSKSVETRIVGIGFGHILTDMVTTGGSGETIGVQDPHNSFVTTLSRSGLVGLTVFLSILLWVFYMAIVGYRRMRIKNRPVAAYFLGVLLFQMYCMVNAWGEPHFEVSHGIIPTFFVYGATWAVWDKLFADRRVA